MDSKKTILENALDQLILRTLFDLEQSDTEVKKAEVKLSEMFDSLKLDDKLDADVQERISKYIDQTIKTANSGFRHVYLQGHKQ